MVPERPKREQPFASRPVVLPGDLAGKFKERTNQQLSDDLPEKIGDLMRRLKESERREN